MFKKIILNLQVILVLLGLFSQIGLFIFSVANNLYVLMTISYLIGIFAFIAVILNVIFGRKYDPYLHYASVGLFLLMVLFNLILPFRDIPQKILLTLLFGLMAVHACKQGRYKFNNYVMLFACLVSLGFSIYSAISANPSAMGEASIKWLTYTMMYISIFTPVIFTGLFGLLYAVREKPEND